jgi:N-acetylneuraminic acid mutarotase
MFIALQCSAQNWLRLADFAGPAIDDGTGFVLGDTAYFGTGLTPWWSAEASFYGLNLNDETWMEIASLPVGKERQYASGFSHSNDKGFVFGGYKGTNFLNDLWSYDPNTNQWTELTPLPTVGRSGASCFVLNETAYVVGGKTSLDAAIDEVWAYSIATNTWTQKNNLPFGNCWRSSAVSSNDFGYLLFGRNELNEFYNTLYIYDPEDDSWSQLTDFPSIGRSHASLSSVNNTLYVLFGVDSLNNSHNDLWKYEISSTTWTNLPGLPALGRRGGIGLTHQNTIYYSTGIDESDDRLTQTWKYVFDLSVLNLIQQKVDKKIIRVIDLMGRKVEDKPNTLLIFVYSDGTTEKVFRVE